jgi:hypothetical protein
VKIKEFQIKAKEEVHLNKNKDQEVKIIGASIKKHKMDKNQIKKIVGLKLTIHLRHLQVS